jgi:NADPH2:quinone reductase
MKAAYIRQTGPPDKIQYGELPSPRLLNSEVLVQVHAVAVNPIDTYLRAGQVSMNLPMPYIMGCDLAGVVIEAGAGVSRFKTGDRVWGSNQGLLGRQGTFAEYAAVDEAWLYPIPASVSNEEAAAGALVSITAHLGLVRTARIKSGETIFVNGGSGGVGSTVVQMAKALGARVITAVGSDAKVAFCRQLGADSVINYNIHNVETAIKEYAPKGVNVWWETTREPDFDRVVDLLTPHGRMIIMAGRQARPPFPIGPFYLKCCSLHGFAMFMFSAEEQRSCSEDINRWLAEGKLKPHIDRVMPLSETAAAHRLQEENTIGQKGLLTGKIVLKP